LGRTSDGTLYTSAEHAAFLTRAAAADNLAVFARYIALLDGVEDDIVECFKQGGEGLGALWSEEKAREYTRNAGFPSIKRLNWRTTSE
jgi:hypothetical protein